MQNGWKGAVKLRVNADAMTLYAVTDRTWVEDTTLMDNLALSPGFFQVSSIL